MNDQDIQEFLKAFFDFMDHAEVEELYLEGRKMVELFYEQKASEMNVSTEYYMMEFV